MLDEGTVSNSSSSEGAGDKGLDISGTDVAEEAKVDPLYGMHGPVSDRRHRWKTYFGALRGFLPSTTQRCPPVLHLLQTFSCFGKSHFI